MAKRKNIATLLKKWRKRRSKELGRLFTQEDAAAELGLNPSTFIQYEHGRRGQKMNQMLYDTILAKTEPNGTSAAKANDDSQVPIGQDVARSEQASTL